jgi:hypothetical protein
MRIGIFTLFMGVDLDGVDGSWGGVGRSGCCIS